MMLWVPNIYFFLNGTCNGENQSFLFMFLNNNNFMLIKKNNEKYNFY